MATKKSSKSSKKDLENKIANLEKQLKQMAMASKSKPAPKPKPAEIKPAPKPEQAKAVPKPAKKPDAPTLANNSQALEVIYRDSAMSNPFDYKTKTPGYSPGPNRYFERLHAKRGSAPTTDWNFQKAKVTGYTAPSNNYFATRQRLAYHPADKRFDGFGYKIEGVEAPTQTQQAPPPQPPKPDAALPKESPSRGTAPKSDLDAYEADYLARLDKDAQEARELEAAARELVAKKRSENPSASSSKGTLPKGF